ncbi:hypothetical protein C8F01DRAFT_1311368 [Mycena amicta]|nr:hypothetical protein C8F01DRAFT_1311368 [Mycena amicta]
MCQYTPSGDNCNICYRPKLSGNNIKVVDCYLKTCQSSVSHPLSLYRNGHATQIIHKHRQLPVLVRSRIPRRLDGESTTVGWDSHAAGGFGTFPVIFTTPTQVQAAKYPQDGYGTFLDNAGSLTDDIATLAPSFAQAIDGESTTATVGWDNHAASGSGHRTLPAGIFVTTPIPAQAVTYQPLALDRFCRGHSACPNCLHADLGVGQWRFGEVSQQMVCSACGLYERRKGTRRPLELETRKMLRLLGGGRR